MKFFKPLAARGRETMYKQTKKDILKKVAAHWRLQYCPHGVWFTNRFNPNDSEREDTYKALLNAKTEDEVVKIIGNNSWTKNDCSECGFDSDHDEVVFLEATDEYGPMPYCKGCLEKALKLFEKEVDK